MAARPVHLVGSVPLKDAEEVFVTVSAALDGRLKRIPDGETGARSDWITWLEPLFAENPAFEPSDEVFRLHEQATPRRRHRLKAGYAVAPARRGRRARLNSGHSPLALSRVTL